MSLPFGWLRNDTRRVSISTTSGNTITGTITAFPCDHGEDGWEEGSSLTINDECIIFMDKIISVVAHGSV